MIKSCNRNEYRSQRAIKRFSVLFCMLFSLLSLSAQDIKVVDFRLDVTDLTANSRETQVLDQNGEKCALIRIQTTQKGFIFDNGSLGIQKTDYSHVGEIWVYVPFGTRHFSIRHAELGSLSSYDFPIPIERARTYIMEISHGQVFVNRYDDSQTQTLNVNITPSTALFTINGSVEKLDENGHLSKVLAFGTYTYKVTAANFYPQEGQITIDNPDSAHTLTIDNLRPMMGKIAVHVSQPNFQVFIDGSPIPLNTSIVPYDIQTGTHTLLVKAYGFYDEERQVEIAENSTLEEIVQLQKNITIRTINTDPQGALLILDDGQKLHTPVSTEILNGVHSIYLRKRGYKTIHDSLIVNRADEEFLFKLRNTLYPPNTLYVFGVTNTHVINEIGGGIGLILYGFNLEFSYYTGLSKHREYYGYGNIAKPTEAEYHPTRLDYRLGYAVAIGNRLRVMPQVGYSTLSITEKILLNNSSIQFKPETINMEQVRASIKLQLTLLKHIGLTVTPEYIYPLSEPDSYKLLHTDTPWGSGFSVGAGLTLFI